jgi:hypothetical protein
LIRIKESWVDPDQHSNVRNPKEDRMPADTLLLSLLICAVFAIFAVVLIWADLTTSRWIRSRQQDTQRAESPAPKRAA